MSDTLIRTTADEVRLHDEIINHGIVDSEPLPVGVMRVFAIRGTTWTLGNGRGDVGIRDLVLIGTDEVWVRRS